jgi:guanosine-diphosphatase
LKYSICDIKPCSFNGVYQPSFLDSFSRGKVLLLSYFYDRVSPLLPPTESHPTPKRSVSTFASLAHIVCQGRPSWVSNALYPHWGTSPSLLAELEGRPEWCLDLTFMHALLRMGYEFSDEREMRIEKKVDGTELGWCLGATIELVGEGSLSCKDREP